MSVEKSNYISQMNPLNPTSKDMLKEGDDHIRLIKESTKNTLPRFDRKISMSGEQLNKMYNWIFTVEDADDKEVLDKFTVLGDAEFRKDIILTEGTTEATAESPKITGLTEIMFTSTELNDPSTIPDEKLSRAVNLKTADNRYILQADKGGIEGGITKLVFENETVAEATKKKLSVTDTLAVSKSIQGPSVQLMNIETDTGNATFNKVDVNTNLKVIGSIFRGSDARLKSNVDTLKAGVLNLRPVSYSKMGKMEYGFIAQEVEKVCPHLVITMPSSKEEDLKLLSYEEIIPMTVVTIQEQQKEIETLKQETKELREMLKSLKQSILGAF